jgi:transcription termination/antitermination protein NusG
MLGERWDRLEVIPDSEIQAIQKLVRSDLPIFPYPYLREGQRVRITHGPLADVEGVLVRGNPKKGLFVVSVDLLRRSVAVQLDCTLLQAA